MTQEKKYFIYLLSCFLNNEVPQEKEVDWNKIYQLSEMHDVAGIIAQEMKNLSPKYQPANPLRSYFIQKLGYTIQNNEVKEDTQRKINQLFDKHHIDHIFVKGCVIKNYYPIRELRTSGDIDIIIRSDEYEDVIEKLKSEDLIFSEPIGIETADIMINGVDIEIHRYHDVKSPYFDDIFSLCENTDGNTYSLRLYDHLLYVLCHLAKHLTQNGAGIRMLMDIDVLIRNIEHFSEEYFYSLCEKAGRLKTAQILLSLCHYYFKTPITSVVNFFGDEELLNVFDKVILDGGSFGFENGDIADFHLVNNIGSSGKITVFTKMKTLFRLFFPPKDYVMRYYEYLKKFPVLLPFAYMNRIFDAVFKRGRHSKNTAKKILHNDGFSSAQYQLLKELDIELDYL